MTLALQQHQTTSTYDTSPVAKMLPKPERRASSDTNKPMKRKGDEHSKELYALVAFLDDKRSADMVMDELVLLLGSYNIPLHQVEAIYLLPFQLGGPLRRLVVDDVVREAEEATLKDWTSGDDAEQLGELFRDLSMALMTVRSSRRIKQAVATDYYVSE